MPSEWGGLDDYELKFESEYDETSNDVIGNNNDLSQVNLNLAEVKKVKLATCVLLRIYVSLGSCMEKL